MDSEFVQLIDLVLLYLVHSVKKDPGPLLIVFLSTTDLKVPSNVGASTASAVEGGGLVFAYPEVESYPKPTFTWTKNNNALQENQRISISAAGNLYIGNVDVDDLASYKSTVRNSVTGNYFYRGPNTISFTGWFKLFKSVEHLCSFTSCHLYKL